MRAGSCCNGRASDSGLRSNAHWETREKVECVDCAGGLAVVMMAAGWRTEDQANDSGSKAHRRAEGSGAHDTAGEERCATTRLRGRRSGARRRAPAQPARSLPADLGESQRRQRVRPVRCRPLRRPCQRLRSRVSTVAGENAVRRVLIGPVVQRTVRPCARGRLASQNSSSALPRCGVR